MTNSARTYKSRLRQQLEQAREYSENLLAAFATPEQWLHQVHPRANHPLWFAGHMAVTDNFLISLIDRSATRDLAGYAERFGIGSEPSPRGEDYPPVPEVLSVMRERREALLGLLDRLSEEDLGRGTPKGAPDFIPDVGTAFQTAAWHEGLHSGQVAVAHRALGHSPLFRPASG